MKNVLIVGVNSYIGKSFQRYICRDLNKEETKGANENERRDIKIDMVSASNGDWINIDYSKYDSVVMLSALVHLKERKNMEQLYHEVNCELPIAIAKKAKESGAKQFIFMSTAAVYGTKVTRITKETGPQPDTFYGRSKLKVSILARTSNPYKQ